MAKAADRKHINLALQGGGSHGAFTWGVIDRLLREETLEIEGITATGSGAINGAVLAGGFAKSGAAGAREALEEYWTRTSSFAWLRPVHAGRLAAAVPRRAARPAARQLEPRRIDRRHGDAVRRACGLALPGQPLQLLALEDRPRRGARHRGGAPLAGAALRLGDSRAT
jgi:predicted acylesterase/phospholipase RssA